MIRALLSLGGRLRWHPRRPHQWSRWAIGERTLFGPYGTTKDPINVRRCERCGMSQHARIDEKVPQSCGGEELP
jgi:hypothetical protein